MVVGETVGEEVRYGVKVSDSVAVKVRVAVVVWDKERV